MRTRIVVPVALVCAVAAALGAGTVASGEPAAQGKPGKQGTENRALFAVLTGRNEVDANGRRGAGDPDGRGSFTAIVDGGQLCFGITVKNIDEPVGAHIHRGRKNENGPIVVPLTQPATGDPGASSGCVAVAPALSRAILKNPHKYYANVHTTAFGAGAVRGQLFRKSN
jgi:CHRD domain-containing protein